MPLRKEIKKVLVIGSGPIVIGQAAEFDYAGTQACLALKEEGIEVVLVNNNPATIMTDSTIADQIYIEPLTVETLETIIQKERPDGMIGTLGGQTGLNLSVDLKEQGILDRYGVELLGTSVDSIKKGEDRDLFRSLMLQIGEPIPESKIVTSYEEGVAFVKEIGYPVIIRPAYTLGGSGGGFATNAEELDDVLNRGLKQSPIGQVLIERSIKGWKEIEYEVMRDANDTCIIVCNMENMDPVGVHTGDSIVVAPSQTLSDVQYQLLRRASLKVIRSLGIIGGCNIQFALDPHSSRYYIIEVNPRVSRSSALASKATGYPIARMATKCAIGYHLDELLNPITGNTYASFEPALDYIVVKLPRFPFDKFSEAERTLGTQMKATGEVMAIDRTFEGALNKGLRSLELKNIDLRYPLVERMTDDALRQHCLEPTDLRLFCIAEAYRRGWRTEQLQDWTQIDPWFLEKIRKIVTLEQRLETYTWSTLPSELLKQAKTISMSDALLAHLFQVREADVRQRRQQLGMKPGYKLVDTCAAEFDAVTPYYYSTWKGVDEVHVTQDQKKVLVIGSGPIRIGQGIEFDYCSVQATIALKEKGYQAIVVNNNPETVSTDYSVADRLYFEPLTTEDLLHVIEKEGVEGVLVQFGGQTAINLAQDLKEAGVHVYGTSVEAIDQLEDRESFYQLLERLNIPHIRGKIAHQANELEQAAQELGFPLLVRPSYVIGGQAMHIFHQASELARYMEQIQQHTQAKSWPLLVDQYLPGKECELDAICDGATVLIPGIFEHVERAGVHSGDSVTVFPPLTLSDKEKETMCSYAKAITKAAGVVGIMNIQFVIRENTVYVLEVNPRASRTVPIMSKVTGVPMVAHAVNVQLGTTLSQLCTAQELLPEPTYYAVKAPVFSNHKLSGVDPALGPEMKSTGEVLGLGYTWQEAYAKAAYSNVDVPFSSETGSRKVVLCSIHERAKEESLPLLKEIVRRGYSLVATEGTATYLSKQDLPVEELPWDKEAILRRLQQGDVQAVINVANQGRMKRTGGFFLREQALRLQIPCYTSLDTLKYSLTDETEFVINVQTLDEYTSRQPIVHQG